MISESNYKKCNGFKLSYKLESGRGCEQLIGFWSVGRGNLLLDKFHESNKAWRADSSTLSKDYKTSIVFLVTFTIQTLFWREYEVGIPNYSIQYSYNKIKLVLRISATLLSHPGLYTKIKLFQLWILCLR